MSLSRNNHVRKGLTAALCAVALTLSAAGTHRLVPAGEGYALTSVNTAVFRDEERGSKASVAVTPQIGSGEWTVEDVTDFSVGAWEPNIDLNLWNTAGRLNIYIQPTSQGDGERIADNGQKSSPVYILEYD